MDSQKFQDALNIKFNSDVGDNITIRYYLRKLLTTLWIEEEGFDGKRPFKNSGWKWGFYAPLIKEGFIKGVLGEDGYVETVNKKEADRFVLGMIDYIFNGETK